MSKDAQLIDMAAMRSKLLVLAQLLRDAAAESDPVPMALMNALAVCDEATAMLNPRLDPDARHPSVDPNAVTDAIAAAHERLLAGGLENPVEILIVQTHDANGKTTGRSLASSAANPQDLLRLCLQNVQHEIQRKRRGR